MKNKYNKDDKVEFEFNNNIYFGTIKIVNFGTFEETTKLQYDILCERNNTLYKHIFEENIICTIECKNGKSR